MLNGSMCGLPGQVNINGHSVAGSRNNSPEIERIIRLNVKMSVLHYSIYMSQAQLDNTLFIY